MFDNISKRLKKKCSVCSRKINVIIYKNFTYRGGHYFGKIPLHTKKELGLSLKAGVKEVKVAGKIIRVLKNDPKPYSYAEYWECPKCYWK